MAEKTIDTDQSALCGSDEKQPLRMTNEEEENYLDLVRFVREYGYDISKAKERTKTGTRQVFGNQILSFSLKHNRFPLLTTKFISFALVAKELLWMLRGDTNSKRLSKENCKIWDANSSRTALDLLGLKYEHNGQPYTEGDCGPIYGFQWRHFGAKYEGCDVDYKDCGIDQIAQVEQSLQKDPHGRRHIVSAWNPMDLHKMVLPPCHMCFQFNVTDENFLDCHMTQRSADLFLGVPMNIASYALLTIMMAHTCKLKPGALHISFGAAHVYDNHSVQTALQCTRIPTPFPTLQIKSGVRRAHVWDFTPTDFELSNYHPQDRIKGAMAV